LSAGNLSISSIISHSAQRAWVAGHSWTAPRSGSSDERREPEIILAAIGARFCVRLLDTSTLPGLARRVCRAASTLDRDGAEETRVFHEFWRPRAAYMAEENRHFAKLMRIDDGLDGRGLRMPRAAASASRFFLSCGSRRVRCGLNTDAELASTSAEALLHGFGKLVHTTRIMREQSADEFAKSLQHGFGKIKI
jgi:hypothetical protein